MTVLVIGVTGKTGRRVVESLVIRGVGVLAIARDLERGKRDVGYSFIWPNYFMEGLLDLFKVDSNRNIMLEVSTGKGQIGAIDTYDIGESSAEFLASGKPLNDHALITGTEKFRWSEWQMHLVTWLDHQ